ncbi:MAG TPA: fasciclin domain-containing protein [Acidimicrobiia bacterium]
MQTARNRLRIVGVATALALLLAACGSGETTDTTVAEPATPTTEAMTNTTMAMTDMTQANMGAGCSAVPAEGAGSFDGMALDPAATAASNNPALSTLVSAVSEAGLVDTLNGDGPFTIFAPTNDAFAAIPEADLNAILADQDLLTSILTYHVVAGESLDAQELIDAGSVETVNGETLTIATSGDSVTINGVAMVVCGNVATANGTVHIVDAVLVPSA